MKIEIENLKAQMTGRKLNIYQKTDALIEFNKLLDYVLEQVVVGQSEQLKLTIPSDIKCMMCGKEKEDYSHNVCDDCGGLAF